jgi:hypothetical protein
MYKGNTPICKLTTEPNVTVSIRSDGIMTGEVSNPRMSCFRWKDHKHWLVDSGENQMVHVSLVFFCGVYTLPCTQRLNYYLLVIC